MSASMMEDEMEAMEKADQLVDAALNRPETLISSKFQNSKWKSLHQKLLELYVEESKKQRQCKMLKPNSYLLDKLVQREKLNTLVVNLYPGNEGFSLMLRGKNGAETETIRLPYEESELLEYIDDEQLPPLLLDLLDKAQVNVFYSGCVIAEVRDYRRSLTDTYDTHYVLLQPTAQSLNCDINAIVASDPRHVWTQDDVHFLESQLLLHTSPPLCLDPSPTVALVANRLNHARQRFLSLRRFVRRHSQAAVNRRKRMVQAKAPPGPLRLHDFLQRRKARPDPSPTGVNLKISKSQCVDMWQQREVHLAMPETIDVPKYATVIERPKTTRDNTPVVVEEYTFETERSHGKVNYSKLTIVQRLSDEFFMGELYVDRDYVENQSKGSTCKFPLGTKMNVEKYIRQFREIFTEEGRRQVKITHKVPGQTPTVTYTQPVPAPSSQSGGNPTLLAQASGLAASLTAQGVGREVGGARKGTPIRLSLALNPQIISSQATPSQSPVAPQGGQLTVNVQQTPQIHINRGIRQIGIYSGPRSGDQPSPASTPTTSGHLPSYTQAMGTPGGSAPSTPSTPTADGGFLSPTGSHLIANQHAAPPNVNISNLPPNINLQNLQSLHSIKGLTSLQGLPANAQVSISLGASTNAGGNLTLPLPLNVISSITQGPSGAPQSILVNAPANNQGVTSPQTIVTMVTAVPSCGSASTSSGASATFSQAGTMLSLPIGAQGNLTQIIAAAGLKGPQSLKPGTPLLLSQIPGQAPVQLLSPGMASARPNPQQNRPQQPQQQLQQQGMASTLQMRPSGSQQQPQLMQLSSQQMALLQQQQLAHRAQLAARSKAAGKKPPQQPPKS